MFQRTELPEGRFEHLRRVEPLLPVIVVSGYSNDPVMAASRDFGFNATVAIPFVMTQLVAAINAALDSAKS